MEPFSAQLNQLLVDTFRSILKVEEQSLKALGQHNLSINEMHLLEAVGKDTGRTTISEIAQELGITLPSVTIAINKLVKKGYVDKIKGEADARTVFVSLTKDGRRMDAVHRYFHEQMVRQLSQGFTEEEKAILLQGIGKLNQFFRHRLAESEET